MIGTQTMEAKAQRRYLIISGQDNLAGLRRYLGKKEPGVIAAALGFWKRQGGLLSQADIDRMISTLVAPSGILKAWEKMNEEFVREEISPEHIDALEFSAKDIEQRIRRIQQKADLPTTEAIRKWLATQAGALITRLDAEIRLSINGILRAGVIETPLSPYQLSKLIRPLIGLTDRWSKAVLNRYNTLLGSGMDAAKALAEADKYATFLHKVRGMNIARTELAEAYNEGQLSALKETGEAIKKRWATADDERVCPICADMDGEERDLNAEFSCGKQRPPAHPGDRCSLEYEMVR
jgi:hypothetical protein